MLVLRFSAISLVFFLSLWAVSAWAGSPAEGPRIPQMLDPTTPTLARFSGGQPRQMTRVLADTKTCAECHREAARQHAASAHKHASFDNPFYRANIETFREERGNHASRFCAGCHDPVLLVSGLIDQAVDPKSELARAGVPCMSCHGATAATVDGNGSYALDLSPVPLPLKGDPGSVEAHRARVAGPLLRSPALCASCHRSFVGPHIGNPNVLAGIDDIGAFRRSAYSGTRTQLIDHEVEAKDCKGCHMPSSAAKLLDAAADAEGRIASHRFPGAQTDLAAASGDPEQERAVEAMLRTAATLDISALGDAQGHDHLLLEDTHLVSGERFSLDVVIRNRGTGHRFPGGTRDIQGTYVVIEIRDAHGRALLQSREDPFRLRAAQATDAGPPEWRHAVNRFRGLIYDHTIEPHDAVLIRYTGRLPGLSPQAFPLVVEAKLIHARHAPELRRLACERARKDHLRLDPDPCKSAVETVLASERRVLGAPPSNEPTAFARLFDLALARSHFTAANLGPAATALDEAKRRTTSPKERAFCDVLSARLLGRLGRVDEALATLASAQSVLGPHPMLARIRGEALTDVFRFGPAVEALSEGARLAPQDPTAWRALTRAQASHGLARDALVSAAKGLAFAPRDEELLRPQALSLQALHAKEAPDARAAWLFHRLPDDLSSRRMACGDVDPRCERDRQPVVTLELVPAPKHLR